MDCTFCGKNCSNERSKKQHEVRCKLNPAGSKTTFLSSDARKKIARTLSARGSLSEEHRANVSSGMKKAHKDGKAWNIGRSRWNNKPSYPEQFFTKVILNEFCDRNFTPEYPVGIYAIDFAWPHKKLAIEIDGDQHQRFQEYAERDKRKDRKLRDEGWQVLRISWKEMFNDTKAKIAEAKLFIDDWV